MQKKYSLCQKGKVDRGESVWVTEWVYLFEISTYSVTSKKKASGCIEQLTFSFLFQLQLSQVKELRINILLFWAILISLL